jgi:hypothetical protein
MKKISIISFLIIATALSFYSCKSEVKKIDVTETKVKEVKKSTAAFAVNNANNDIKFIAYKMTEKVGVGGWFKKVNVLSGGEGNTVKEAIDNTEFSIPVSSLATKDSSRDYKIKKFFFGIMDNTRLLTGRLKLTDDANGLATLTMNGETKDVPFSYTIVGSTFNLKATMDVNNWNAGKALASLNEVCKLLHTGGDGISKTWSEVTLDITSSF